MCEFEKYKKLIQKKAWKCSRDWKIDYEECLSEAYVLYCEALKLYNPNKLCFASYLTLHLMKLNQFAKYYWKKRDYDFVEDCEQRNIDFSYEDSFYNGDGVIDKMKESVSEKTLLLYKWIVGRSWEHIAKDGERGRRKPTIKDSAIYFNVSVYEIKQNWKELGDFFVKNSELF